MQIDAMKEVQIALAQAIGSFASQGNYTVYGTPETMADMMSKLSKGLGIGSFIDGVGKSVLGNGDRSPAETAGELANLIGDLAKKVTGKDVRVSDDTAKKVAEILMSQAEKPEPKSEAKAAESGQRADGTKKPQS